MEKLREIDEVAFMFVLPQFTESLILHLHLLRKYQSFKILNRKDFAFRFLIDTNEKAVL